MNDPTGDISPFDVAIVGMSGKFPGARSVEALWDALLKGVELTSPRFAPVSSTEIAHSDTPVVKRILLDNMIDDLYGFDAEFFNVSPLDAKLTDPQHRLALESCYDALTRANVPHAKSPLVMKEGDHPTIGLFASKYSNTYLLERVYPAVIQKGGMSALQSQIANDGDHLGPFIAYKLGLSGPVISVQNACSSSLVSVHLACESLISGQCDVALVTAATVSLWQNGSYDVTEGALTSNDGHCKPFSTTADGTVYTNGVCTVVLKRLEDAVSDQSDIYAVIKGSAVNNDAERRMGYAVPSVDGQKAVVSKALSTASVDSRQLDFIECHGTGTNLGDKIEVQALQDVHKMREHNSQPCYLSSVKANIGHLGVASGLAGLIKVSLSLRTSLLPPQLNCPQSLPEISNKESGFGVNQNLAELPKTRQRFAGLSSFGLGGTNAHTVLASWPPMTSDAEERPDTVGGSIILPFSARTQTGLDRLIEDIGRRLETIGPVWADDMARCLYHHREDYPVRAAVVVEHCTLLNSHDTLKDGLNFSEAKDLVEPYLLFSGSEQAATDLLDLEVDEGYAKAIAHWKSIVSVDLRSPSLLSQRVLSVVSQCAKATRVATEVGPIAALAGDGTGWIAALLFAGVLSGDQTVEMLEGLPDKEGDIDIDGYVRSFLNVRGVRTDQGPVRVLNSLDWNGKIGVPSYLNGLIAAALNQNAIFIEVGSPGAFSEAHHDFSASGNKLAFHSFSALSGDSLERLRAFLWSNGAIKLRAPVAKSGFCPALPVPELINTHYEIPAAKILVEEIDGEDLELSLKQNLQRLWHEVFSIKAAIDDDIIFEHGATSLTIANFVETLCRELDVHLEIADIYECPSFAAQLQLIKERM
ncbi:Phthiocerol/phenolphthiocerol synthesis polyketide synthase type I PpsE [Pseudovibrio sp. Ad46]|uniref:type I polyketide synthase n=1 Tax=Pseudovibrio sp. Ad46 TaxID=989432 RepID=UPI0007AED7EF|nr:type I polyketide synthase [Pseudovibrio sp. Ad46]KZK81603.1 Phthiocerol/phenolphthiocerol synthesis polyketide synthase type I PpsE [Pseudovibrio sp. Ad46]